MKYVCAAAIVAFLGASGCVTYYQEPAPNPESARVTFEKGYDKSRYFMNEVGQDYAVVQDNDCSGAVRIAFFTGVTGDFESKRVSAGRPFKIYTDTTRDSIGLRPGIGVGVVGQSRCGFLAKFTPEAGKEYSVALKMSDFSSCKLEIFDKVTGNKPIDLQVVENFTCEVPIPYRTDSQSPIGTH